MHEQLEGISCPMKAQMQIDIALDELLSNIIHFAYPDRPGEMRIEFSFDEAARAVSITLIDRGIPFDPLPVTEPDTSLPLQDRQIGGLGIFMVRKTMDEMSYRYEDGCNRLTIRKNI